MAVNTPYTHRVNAYQALSTTQPRYVSHLADALGVHPQTLRRHARWLVDHGYAQRTKHGLLRTNKAITKLQKLATDEQACVSLERLGLRLCARCGKQKAIADFMRPDGLRRQCNVCRAHGDWMAKRKHWTEERWNEYRQRKINYNRAYRQRNRDRILAYAREYERARRAALKAQRIAARLATVRVVRRERQEVA